VRRFPAPWDRSLRISTGLLVLLLGGIAVGVTAAIVHGQAPAPLAALTAGLPLLSLAVVWAFAPRAYALTGLELRVERNLAAPLRIPLATVRAVGELPPEATRRSLKVAGSAGLFGTYGRFHSGALGAFRMYATRRDRLVAVRTAGELFVLSPEPPGRFVDALLAAAPAAERAGAAPGGGPALALAPGRLPWRPLVAALAVAALAVAGIALALGSRAPRSIAVQGAAIVIERSRAAPITIPLAEVRAVEPLPPSRLAGLRRTAGTRGFGAAWGTFWSPALGRFELQAIDGRGGFVLVRREGDPLVLTPDDPEAFVAAARAGLAERP
jgi:hypothetical protein